MPGVDILIPNYQYGRFLRQCVSSVLAQKVDDIRILIVDNASTDESVDVANQLAAEDQRIEVRVHERNLGLHASVNEGIDWAESDYFMVLCADDLLPPGALACAMKVMEEHPDVSFAYGAYLQHRDQPVAEQRLDVAQPLNVEWTITSGSDFIRQHRLIPMVSPLVRTSSQKRAGYYRTKVQFAADMELMLRLACYGNVASTTSIQAIQRLHQSNLSTATWSDPVLMVLQQVAIYESFFEHEGKQLPDAALLHRRVRRTIGEAAYWKALSLIFHGWPYAGIRVLNKAVQLAPKVAIIPPVSILATFQNPLHRFASALFKRQNQESGLQ